MSLLAQLGLNRLPTAAREATLLIGTHSELALAGELLAGLQTRFGNIAIAGFEDARGEAPQPYVKLPVQAGALRKTLSRLAPRRLVLLGDVPHAEALVQALAGSGAQTAAAPLFWVNIPRRLPAGLEARALLSADPVSASQTRGAELTGDPLLGIEQLPDIAACEDLCERFRDHHKAGRWIGYFAATGEGEEPLAYGTFFTLTRRKMGLLALAPRDAERYEPVYRDAIKYHLPTNRHNRLSTSFVPIKSRVYYIEDPQTLTAIYRCADFVVAGGSLNTSAQHSPDILTPLCFGRPVIVGAVRRDPVVRSALTAGAVIAADDEDALVEAAFGLVSDEALAREQAERGRRWAEAQPGALARVLERIAQASLD